MYNNAISSPTRNVRAPSSDNVNRDLLFPPTATTTPGENVQLSTNSSLGQPKVTVRKGK